MKQSDGNTGESGTFRLEQGDMNPCRLLLHTGQIIKKIERDENGRRPRMQTIKIVKLYPHHALCSVGGRLESFSYNELSQWEAVRKKVYGKR